MTTRCDCCDLPVECCGEAIEDAERVAASSERSQLLALPGWFESRYPGVCGRCGERFSLGQPIVNYPYGWACCSALPDYYLDDLLG